MNNENYISVLTLCTHYNVEKEFIYDLNENDLLDIIFVEQEAYLHDSVLVNLEKMLRLHQELNLNVEGIDAVLTLIKQVEDLQLSVLALKNRVNIYEDN